METISINGKNILRLEFFFTVIWILQSEVAQTIFIYAKKYEKPAKLLFCLIWPRNNKISNLRELSQCKSITIRLTTWDSKVPKQFDLLCNKWKNCKFFFIGVHNVKYIPLGIYFCPNSIKIENETVSTKKVNKKEEQLNLNLAEPSQVHWQMFPEKSYSWISKI